LFNLALCREHRTFARRQVSAADECRPLELAIHELSARSRQLFYITNRYGEFRSRAVPFDRRFAPAQI
jgi:hypothetical protein